MDNKINVSDPLDKSNLQYRKDTSDEIDLIDLFIKIWHKRKFIMLSTVIFLLLGLFIAFASPVSYTASSTLVPQLGERRGSNLGGLASMMGISLGSSLPSETLSPAVYPQIINSVTFCKDIMETSIIVEKSNGKPITLYEYYIDSKHQPANILGSVKKYTIGLPGLLLSTLRSGTAPVFHADTVVGKVVTLTRNERRVIKNIQNSILFDSNPKEGYIILGYSFSEPESTAVIAQNMYATLEKYVKSYKAEKQLENLLFVEENYEKARESFMEKQDALAKFQDTNRDLTSAMARTTERRLSSEYEVSYTIYNELARQLEQAKIAVKESTPVLTVVDPVVVPHQKSAPRRFLILFVFLFVGVFTSISWVLIKPFVKNLFTTLKREEKEVYNLNT